MHSCPAPPSRHVASWRNDNSPFTVVLAGSQETPLRAQCQQLALPNCQGLLFYQTLLLFGHALCVLAYGVISHDLRELDDAEIRPKAVRGDTLESIFVSLWFNLTPFGCFML